MINRELCAIPNYDSICVHRGAIILYLFLFKSPPLPNATTDISIIVIDWPLSMTRSGLINEIGVSMNGSIEILEVHRLLSAPTYCGGHTWRHVNSHI